MTIALVAAAVTAAGLLGGCGDIKDPYQSQTGAAASRTETTLQSAGSTATDAGDPAPERGGTIPAQARASQNRLAAGAGGATPQAVLVHYANLFINWSASNVLARQLTLASISLGQARAQAMQAAASVRHDTLLTRSHVADTGQIVAISHGSGPAAGVWVIVTRELTAGQGDYEGLPPTLHITYAQLSSTSQGWVVSKWQPQN